VEEHELREPVIEHATPDRKMEREKASLRSEAFLSPYSLIE
jgi:hypothetical protein